MAPEEQAPQEDTPEPDSQQGTPDNAADTDWQQRYENLQPEYTRATQELEAARQYQEAATALQSEDPQERFAAAEFLGLQFTDDTGNQEEDPSSVLDRRLADIEAYLQTGQEEAAAEEMQAQDVDHINEALSGFETRIGRELSDEEVQLLASHAILNRTEEGPPGIEEALKLYEGVGQNQNKRWADTKRVSVPSTGQEGSETPDLNAEGHPDRVSRMVERLQANS